MKDAKVISLRDRLAGYAGIEAEDDAAASAEDGVAAEPEFAPGVCRKCGRAGATDFVDLVAQRAKLHCPACWHCWDEVLPEPVDARSRARRADAAIRRQRH